MHTHSPASMQKHSPKKKNKIKTTKSEQTQLSQNKYYPCESAMGIDLKVYGLH